MVISKSVPDSLLISLKWSSILVFVLVAIVASLFLVGIAKLGLHDGIGTEVKPVDPDIFHDGLAKGHWCLLVIVEHCIFKFFIICLN